MPKSEKDNRIGKVINLPPEVWDVVGSEAKSLHRSTTKQIEMILRERYGLDAPVQGVGMHSVLADMKRRMDDFEASLRPLLDVVETKQRLNEGEGKKAKK